MPNFKYPYRITEGREEVVIYRMEEGFTVAYRINGERKRVKRHSEGDAHRDAKRALHMLLNRPVPFAQSDDALAYRAAQLALVDFPGIGVEDACREFARARKVLAETPHLGVDDACRQLAELKMELGGIPLADFIASHRKHKPLKADRDVSELLLDYLAEIEPRTSRDGFKNTRSRLRRFARTFGSRKIHTIEEDELSKWMTKLGVANRSRNNERQALVTFFNWCQTKRYLPRDVTNEAALIPMLKARSTVEIYTLDEVARLLKALQAARSPLLPYTATGFFTGIRPGELARLRYEEAFRWSHGDIEVRADQAKTGQRRLVPMTENWREWMRPYRPCTGALAVADADEKLAKFAKSIGLKWPRDVMRHSYISYNVAEAEQIGKVAMWAGNSEQIVKTNYLKMVTKAEGEAFGKIMPDWPENVVHIAAA